MVSKEMCMHLISSFEMYANISVVHVNMVSIYAHVSRMMDSQFIGIRLGAPVSEQKKNGEIREESKNFAAENLTPLKMESHKLRAWRVFSIFSFKSTIDFKFYELLLFHPNSTLKSCHRIGCKFEKLVVNFN